MFALDDSMGRVYPRANAGVARVFIPLGINIAFVNGRIG